LRREVQPCQGKVKADHRDRRGDRRVRRMYGFVVNDVARARSVIDRRARVLRDDTRNR
jgi:hypothetical protein